MRQGQCQEAFAPADTRVPWVELPAPRAPLVWAVCPGTPVGDVWVGASACGVVAVAWAEKRVAAPGTSPDPAATPEEVRAAADWAGQAVAELSDYFRGARRRFTVPVAVWGTPFQLAVWRVLCTIPYGATWSYADVAAALGRPQAVRAVGQANRANRVPILVPCHRVIGKDGSLVGYAGRDLDRKAVLLAHERAGASGAGRAQG
ncbi:hypothetical protein GCM10010885_13390 [Alicyclobacillus cellulosilyticus]|uniref:methylated-DNA--[protein]-cysteine S-methyltransferase n=1 Tax=Alicyclobacillus cellulosilyticus TaxID=1003997 RepID=A0A917NJM4_9BACL|nr:methylated-DNA--[protein]-cysteine S-methyltransferase [Alicyclobacillus cellulosilyticus]GGJ05578.1 hypothetical protein GCM10010885_13390 [Alicyclobacillus cellulosilyticus]